MCNNGQKETKMAPMIEYQVILEEDESALRCIIPAFPSVFTFGRDREEALSEAKEAIELEVSILVERGQAVPRSDTNPSTIDRVAVSIAG
jgi:predicted RNase H-like HicB family nuclease